MTFQEVLAQVLEWLQHDQRISYRAVKRQFALDDVYLDDLKVELIEVKQVAVDQDGIMLVWTGASPTRQPAMRLVADVESRLHALLPEVIGLLQRERRVTYRRLQYVFGLDEALLHDMRQELTFRQVAHDEQGEGLVWLGEAHPALPASAAGAPQQTPPAAAAITSPVPPPVAPSTLPTEPAAPAPARSAPEAERRQVTVLFCDLVDSTKLSRQLDPEDYRIVVRAYQEAAEAAIQAFDGYVAQYLGDGLLVYFGWPQAHEDAALRAVHASLAIVDAMGPLNTRLEPHYQVQVAVRCGLHTGLAVIGAMGSGPRQEQLAMGDTPNIAARLQGLTAPNTAVCSAVTGRLVQGAFALEALGAHLLKGLAAPLEVFRVRGLLAGQEADEDAVPGTAPFLVGRDEEVGLLLRRWAQSTAGQGQVVLLRGEAGIGKTALVQALRVHVRQQGGAHITLRCSPYHTHSALYPVIDYFQRLLRLERDETAATRLAKLEQALRTAGQPVMEVVPLLAALLAIPLPAERYTPLSLSPHQQRHQTQDALVAWLLAAAECQPVLAVYEELHWADPSTLELLGVLLEQAPTVSMLHVLTFRPDFVPPWPQRSHMTPMALNRLEGPQVEALLMHLAGDKALPIEVVAHIVAKTDGVPLFVEELTKMLLESALLHEDTAHYRLTGPLAAVPIPTTLQDSLMARLDRLPGGKDLAQLGAVLGREFAYELLQAIAPLDDATLQAQLAQLVAAELLYQRGRPLRATYTFKHALIQDAAYQSLLTRTRQQVHRQVAQVLEAQFPETVETQPELVAQHYTEAGLPAHAIPYWQRAGQQALQRSANPEAVRHLTAGLELLATLPETPALVQQALDLQIALGPALVATQGWGAPEVEQTYARAQALCQQVGETSQLLPTLGGLWRCYLNRGALPTARELGEQLFTLAHREAVPTHRLEAYAALGTTLFFLGDYASAWTHLAQGLTLADPTQQWALALRHGEAPGVTCLTYATHTLWCLGYPAQAVQREREALALAEALAHPFSLALAQHFAASLHHRRREIPAVQAQAEVLLTLATAQRFPLWVGVGTCWRGWALVMQGEGEAGLTHLRQGMTAVLATGQTLTHPFCLILLAEAAGYVGQVEEGLHLLTEARAALEASGRGDLLAETYRLQGTLLLRHAIPDVIQAEDCFQQALAVARRQQAKSWELRAAMSLSRLWQCQGKRAEARSLLAPVYKWFTEGFDTADVQEAQALLEELGA